MRRTPDEVYAALIAAGWPPDAAVTMTAIAGAESGWDNDALGDIDLQDATWGPSFGLFQIRTLKADVGSGSPRDPARLALSDVEQARAAWEISQGGTDFTPWSVYNTGAYQAYLAAARAAAERVGGPDDGPFPTVGPWWLPWNLPSAAGNVIVGRGEDMVTTAITGAQHIVMEASMVITGLAVAGVGLWLLVRGVRR